MAPKGPFPEHPIYDYAYTVRIAPGDARFLRQWSPTKPGVPAVKLDGRSSLSRYIECVSFPTDSGARRELTCKLYSPHLNKPQTLRPSHSIRDIEASLQDVSFWQVDPAVLHYLLVVPLTPVSLALDVASSPLQCWFWPLLALQQTAD